MTAMTGTTGEQVVTIETEPGVQLRVRIAAAKDQPFLILGNSIGADLSMWDGQMDTLRECASVIRYDQRGHGASTAPKGPFTVEQLGRDVIAIADRLGVDRFSFCGLSLGGLTGMWLGVEYPSRISSLLLVNTAAHFPKDVWLQRSAVARAEGLDSLIEPTLQRWFTPQFTASQPEVVDRTRRMIKSTSPEGYAACGDVLGATDLRGRLGAVKCPVRIVAGRHDPATPPARSFEILQEIPASDVVTLDAAHVSPLEARHAFNVLLHDFMVTRVARVPTH